MGKREEIQVQPKLGECWLQEDNKMNVSCTIEWKCLLLPSETLTPSSI